MVFYKTMRDIDYCLLFFAGAERIDFEPALALLLVQLSNIEKSLSNQIVYVLLF